MNSSLSDAHNFIHLNLSNYELFILSAIQNKFNILTKTLATDLIVYMFKKPQIDC